MWRNFGPVLRKHETKQFHHTAHKTVIAFPARFWLLATSHVQLPRRSAILGVFFFKYILLIWLRKELRGMES